MPKWSNDINHLAYKDETIVFFTTKKKFLNVVMEILGLYED